MQAVCACCLLAVLAVGRSSSEPLVGFQGLLTAIYLGQPLLMGSSAGTGVGQYWLGVVVPWVGVATAALCASVMVSLLVMPTLASERVEQSVSDVVLCLAQYMSGYGSQVLAPGSQTRLLHPHLEGVASVLQQAMLPAQVKVGGWVGGWVWGGGRGPQQAVQRKLPRLLDRRVYGIDPIPCQSCCSKGRCQRHAPITEAQAEIVFMAQLPASKRATCRLWCQMTAADVGMHMQSWQTLPTQLPFYG